MTTPDPWPGDRRRVRTGVSVLVVGLAILAVAAVLAWSWRADLPDPVASHWGVDGAPDGFSALRPLLGLVLGLGGVLVVVFAATTWGLGQTAVIRRIGAAATIWAALFLALLLLGSLEIQRGLTDARASGGVGGVLLVAVLGSVVAAAVTAVAVPGDPPRPTGAPVAADALRAPLAEGVGTVWTARVASPAAFAIAVPVGVLLVLTAVLTRTWAVLLVPVLVLALLVSLSAFDVRIDQSGVRVRSVLRWPSYRVPLDEIVRADVTQVSPVRDFGGWGLRVGRGGRVGVVLRKGEAVAVTRTGGRSLVVTVDDAATAAGLVNALADRVRGR